MSTLERSRIADAGRLIGWAARPKERPARHEDYANLVHRYDDDEQFRDICNSVAAGLGLTLTIDREVGVVAVAEPDSPLRMPAAEFTKRTNGDVRKAVNGVILLGIARTAFPNAAQLDNTTRVPRFSVDDVVAYLNRVCDETAENAPDAEEHDEALDELWRGWLRLRQSRSEAQRSSDRDRVGLVRKMCSFLEDQGMLQSVSDDEGGTWRATSRMRIVVRNIVEDSDIYNDLLRREASLATQDDEQEEAR